jgi:hypothetical protein
MLSAIAKNGGNAQVCNKLSPRDAISISPNPQKAVMHPCIHLPGPMRSIAAPPFSCLFEVIVLGAHPPSVLLEASQTGQDRGPQAHRRIACATGEKAVRNPPDPHLAASAGQAHELLASKKLTIRHDKFLCFKGLSPLPRIPSRRWVGYRAVSPDRAIRCSTSRHPWLW